MDKNERQEGQGQEKQQKSAIDRLNQGINLARDAKSTYEISKRVAKKLKRTKMASRGLSFASKEAQLAIRGAQLAIKGAAATVEIWGPIALIVGFIVLVIIIIIIIFTGVSAPPTCRGLTANPTTISNSIPAILTLENCSENVTYSWDLPQIGGTFSAPQGTTTSYTPPKVNSDQKIYIFVNVCSSSNQDNCSQYSTPQLTISKEDLFSCNGYCALGNRCESPDVAGQGTCPSEGQQRTCCRTNPGPGPTKCETNPTDCLKKELNILVGGNTTEEKRSDVYRLLSEVAAASRYKTLLKASGPTTLEFINDPTKGGGCPARVKPIGGGRSLLILYNYDLNGCYRTTRKSRLAHETGHIIRNGHMRLFQQFESQGYYPKDKSCYKIDNRFSPRYFINTYNTSFGASQGVSISGSNETLAEFIALSVIPSGGYPSRCTSGYNWVKKNIFDNYVF